MNKKNMFAIVPIMLALALTGCGDKTIEAPSSPTSSSTVEETPAPVAPAPIGTVVNEPPAATGLENTDAAELEGTIKSYNGEVNASNDKARDIVEAYNEKIESATGK